MMDQRDRAAGIDKGALLVGIEKQLKRIANQLERLADAAEGKA